VMSNNVINLELRGAPRHSQRSVDQVASNTSKILNILYPSWPANRVFIAFSFPPSTITSQGKLLHRTLILDSSSPQP
jgi:hypothetical protein